MTARGDATRARLLDATRAVVREAGYAHASTRAIAAAAGVAEGTIYRHFPDKAALFFAAVLDANQAIVDDLASLPTRAGSATVEANLVEALSRLATLRDDILPLELAIATDPVLVARQRDVVAGAASPPVGGPPEAIGAYLAAEQGLGRVRADFDAWQLAMVLLAGLFGLGTSPTRSPDGPRRSDITTLVRVIVEGIGPRPRPEAGDRHARPR